MIARETRLMGVSLCLLLIPVGIGAAEAARVEKTFETTPNPRVNVSNVSGKVVVKGWDKSQVHAVYTTGSPRVEADAEAMPEKGQAERVRFVTRTLDPQVTGKDETADYSLDVPLNSSLEIRNPQGNVQVEHIQGDVHVTTVAAPISVADTQGHLHVESVGGGIDIVRPSGRVEATSVNGDIHFVAPASSEIRGNTTSGKITYDGNFVPLGNYNLYSYSGDVDVYCPPTASFELSANTKGKVYNDFRITPKQRPVARSPYYNTLLGTYHEGKATLDLRSYGGAIHIRQR